MAQKEGNQRLQSSPPDIDQDRHVFGTAELQRQPPHDDYVNIYEMPPAQKGEHRGSIGAAVSGSKAPGASSIHPGSYLPGAGVGSTDNSVLPKKEGAMRLLVEAL